MGTRPDTIDTVRHELRALRALIELRHAQSMEAWKRRTTIARTRLNGKATACQDGSAGHPAAEGVLAALPVDRASMVPSPGWSLCPDPSGRTFVDQEWDGASLWVSLDETR